MSASSRAFFLITAAILLCALPATDGRALGKRNVEGCEDDHVDYPDYKLQKPMQKRAAAVIDRLVVMLQRALDNMESGPPKMQLADKKMMHHQLRRQAEARLYWICYFNPVACFGYKGLRSRY